MPQFSQLQYGAVVLNVVTIQEFNQSVVKTDDGTDYQYIKFDISVLCIVNQAAISYNDEQPPVHQAGISPVTTDKNLREYLMQPRRSLTLLMNGETWLQSPPAPAGKVGISDDLNGPQPISFDPVSIAGAKTHLYIYRITTWLRECPNPIQADAAKYLVSNRWTMTHDTDDRFITTVTTTGRAVFSLYQMKAAGKVADEFRQLCIIPIPDSFKRTRLHVAINAIGNVMDWSVQDVEQAVDLGDTIASGVGVTKIRAYHLQQSNPQTVAGQQQCYTTRTVGVTVEGTAGSLRENLLEWAFALVQARLNIQFGPGADPHSPRVSAVQIRESLDDRVVELTVATFSVPGNPAAGATPFEFTTMTDDNLLPLENEQGGIIEGFNPQPPRARGTRGTYCGLAVAQELQVACSAEGVSQLDHTGQDLSFGDPKYLTDQRCNGIDDTEITVIGAPGKETPNQYKPDNGLFTEWSLNQKMDRKNYFIVGPVASSDGTPPEVMRAASSVTHITVDWTAERIGDVPILPNPNVNNQGWTLLGISELQPTAGELLADIQTYVYRVSGRYHYVTANQQAIGNRGVVADAFGVGALPWTMATYGQVALTAENFDHGIIDNASGGQAAARPNN